jgi:hypothetical protein
MNLNSDFLSEPVLQMGAMILSLSEILFGLAAIFLILLFSIFILSWRGSNARARAVEQADMNDPEAGQFAC